MFDLVPPSMSTTAALLTIVALAVIMWIALAYRAGEAIDEATGRRWGIRASLFALLWLTANAALAESGVLESMATPPPALFYLVALTVAAVLVARSRLGRQVAHATPLAALVALQAFRLPLELVLYCAWLDDTLPKRMTFAGANFDLLSGALALPAAWVIHRFGERHVVARRIAAAFTLLGVALLLNVITIAVLSSPGPARLFTEGPAVTLLFHAPYTWLVSVLVESALLLHLLALKRLRRAG